MKRREPAHVLVQKQGKARDLHTCQICGSTNHTEGHHLIDYSFGGAADTDNIITLCHECHTNVHKGIIDLFRF